MIGSQFSEWLSTTILTLMMILGSVRVAHGQSFTLGFPIAGQNPYTAPIITVLDHSADYFYDQKWTQVVAYTGEMGEAVPSLPNGGCSPSGKSGGTPPCGFYNPNFSSGNPVQFIVNGSYVGNPGPPPNGDSPYQLNVLNYRGHSGFDYGYPQNTTIIAAQGGMLYVPAQDPVNNWGGSDPWCTLHSFYIDHGNGWTTWYLHADHLTVGTPHACPSGVNSNIASDQPIAQVQKGQPVAVVGTFASGVVGGVGPHLHFEVRRGCNNSTGSLQGCMVVDPYGWEWPSGDPIAGNHCANVNAACAAVQAAPLWSLTDWNVQQPIVTSINLTGTSGSYTATITGQNFSPSALVTLWDQGQYFLMTLPSTSVTIINSTQIVAQLSNLPVSSPTELVLKVRNPQGPRSVGIPLSLSASTSSEPLILNGQPAPGGGAFAGFAGFWSFNNRGEAVFNAGVDTNADGAPDYFADFKFSANQITKPAVPGFSAISSVVTHIRLNNRGDMAFGDVSGLYGALPAGIYVIPAGSTSPIPVVKWGQACPSPCPGPSSSTIYQLYGPLAFDDSGDVAFAAGLLNPQTNTTACCFLFLYSGTNGSIVKVAADGPSGDVTPVGGTFASGTLLPPNTQITSDGDVIFLAQVNGGTRAGGIFRYSRTGGLSKVVTQGDAAPVPGGGVFGYPLFGKEGSVSGRQLAFHAPISGGTTTQLIALIHDVTQPSSMSVVYQGEATSTSAGGIFSNGSGRPFGWYGQNTAPPGIRADGAVVFHSSLVGAHSASGAPTDAGVFLWNPRGFQKIVSDGDSTTSGGTVQGVFATDLNDLGQVLYFAASVK